MSETSLKSTTPKRVDPRVRQLLNELCLPESSAVWLKLHKPKFFKPELSECHINASIQSNYESGSTVTGWTIWQDKALDFVEAQFHTVWKDSAGVLRDVTPRQDKERTVLFVPDSKRPVILTDYDGKPAIKIYDNVRMQQGQLLNGIAERVHVLVTNLIYEHDLATRSNT
jgi:hypothetical protein